MNACHDEAATYARVLAALGETAAPFNVGQVGCGDGAECRLWARRGHRVFGADQDAAMIAQARRVAREAGQEILFDVACGEALPWPDRSMDVVLAGAVLDDPARWRGCLSELVRVLRPGGALCLGAGAESVLSWQRWQGVSVRLAHHGLACLDHIDLAGLGSGARARRAAFALLRAAPPLRLCARAALPASGLLAFKAA
jgi:SAM-dependent methyltransferase